MIVGVEAEEANARPPLDISPLSQADLTVDAIGPAFRHELLCELSQLQVLPYERLFRPGRPHGPLDMLEFRWDWFRRLIDTAEDLLQDVIPRRWNFSRYLYREFSERTKKHLYVLLTDVARSYSGGGGGSVQDIQNHMADQNIPRISDVFDSFLSPYVLMERRNMEEHMIRFEAEDENETAGSETANDHGGKTVKVVTAGDPFESSRKMFEFVKSSVRRGIAFSRGKALLSLADELRAVIRQYAINLRNRCPQPLPTSTSSFPTPGVGDFPSLVPLPLPLPPGALGTPVAPKPVYVVSVSEEFELCRVINTAEYCADVLPQLETLIKSKIRPDLAGSVTFNVQAEAFMDAVAHATSVLVAGVCERTDPAFRTMRKTNWSQVTSVGDDSPYVAQIKTVLEVAIPRVRDILSPLHFKNICLKISTEIISKFQEMILKQKKIINTGAEQLLLDLNSLKSFLLKLHNIGSSHSHTYDNSHSSTSSSTSTSSRSKIPDAFINIITMKSKQIETILKLICTEEHILEERFNIMWPEGQPSDLQMILNLKRGQGLDNVANSMKSAVEHVGDHLGVGINSAGGGISSTAGVLTSAVSGTMMGISSMGSNVGEGISSTAKSAFGGLGKVNVGGAFEGLGKAGGSAFKDIKKGLNLGSVTGMTGSSRRKDDDSKSVHSNSSSTR
eukprot:gene13062-27567_t